MGLTNRQIFLANMAQTSPSPMLMEVVSAKGVELYGSNGEVWIDLISGISVSSVGHSHPKVVDAVCRQSEKYMHLMVYGELVLSPQTTLARDLTALLPVMLDSCYFVNSGSEAMEGAMKLAKRFTGRPGIVAFHDAYHGSTQGALSIIGSEYFRRSYRPLLPAVEHLNYGVEEQLELIDHNTACVVVEMVRGEAGAVDGDWNFIRKLYERCKLTGTLFVVDEIQSGFFRTGPFMAFMDAGIVPDILVLGKAMGGGMPMGAFVANKSLMSSLINQPVLGHITTFGGHPVCSAAATSALEVLKEIGRESIDQKALLFRRLLTHERINSITGKGLMMGVDLGTEEFNKKVIDVCLSKGVFTDWFLFAPHKMRIAPPLVISESEIEKACLIILASIDEVAKMDFNH
ncbi:MAG: aspartate aminotransferase family protein [Bacteroidota bacterium]|jgi:acetylornithine/succinyldiaminopimelate/putrescine aminotransferase